MGGAVGAAVDPISGCLSDILLTVCQQVQDGHCSADLADY